jgi:hypothetical protein
MRLILVAAALAAGTAGAAFARDVPQSGPAENGSPAWVIVHDENLPSRNLAMMCREDIPKFCAGQAGQALRVCLATNKARVSQSCRDSLNSPGQLAGTDTSKTPNCVRSVVCNPAAGNNPGGVRQTGGIARVEWRSSPLNLGYRPTYPYELPPGGGGATSVSMDSKGNLWVLQRVFPGSPELFKFGPDHRLLLALGEKELGAHQDKAHGLKVDPEDNVWICDTSGATVKKISPDGKLLLTLGTHGHPGDWDESKGQRYLWQPISIAFAADGSAYIAEGHANESPNDAGGSDPTNRSGAARIIHVGKDGKFIAQWYGDEFGPGKFFQAHDVAVDPRNGDVWIGDREEHRLVVYTAEGQFVKSLQTRNLTCNIAFDAAGELWVGTGQDGQFLHMDRSGKVLGAIGNGRGPGDGQVGETGYITWDRAGNLITGSTGQDRVTVWVKPGR